MSDIVSVKKMAEIPFGASWEGAVVREKPPAHCKV